jgi:hypothetical protein
MIGGAITTDKMRLVLEIFLQCPAFKSLRSMPMSSTT